MICTKCGNEFEGNFCPQCGQKIAQERYTSKRIVSDTLDTLDIREGFLKTVISLFKNPGPSIKDHLMGRSVMYNPLKLLLIIGAISTYCTAKFYTFDQSSVHLDFLNLYMAEELNEYSGKYFTFTNIVGIPLFSLSSWIIFKRAGYNYLEHLILNTYVTIVQLIIMVIGAPFFFIAENDSYVNLPLLIIQNIYFVWAFATFFSSSKLAIPKTILTVVVGYILAFFSNYFLFLMIPAPLLEFFEIF